MSVEQLNEIKQRISVLTPDERHYLSAFLAEQAEIDKRAANHPSANEHQEEPDPYRRRELEWRKQHRAQYAGQYVAVLGDGLIAHAATLRELHRLVKASGVKRALFMRIEALDELPFGGW